MSAEAQKFLLSIIDVKVWDKAVWRGCAFFFDEGQPPTLALMFDREESAREIFAGLRSLVGQDDEECLLRICIIEGRFEGNNQAYAVSVGPHYANVLKGRFGLSKEEFETERFYTLSRLLRVNPRTLEPLNSFKRLFRQYGVYKLVPALVTGNLAKELEGCGIYKHDLVLRKKSDISPVNDIDAPALKEYNSLPKRK